MAAAAATKAAARASSAQAAAPFILTFTPDPDGRGWLVARHSGTLAARPESSLWAPSLLVATTQAAARLADETRQPARQSASG
jgi:hypothetical protein